MQLSIEPNPKITFGVAYEDEHILVVEKASGVVTLPGKGRHTDTLLNGVFASHGQALQNVGRSRDFGLLHRLDKDTSGLVAFALTPQAADTMHDAFRSRQVRKFYWAICNKAPSTPTGVIKLGIAETHGGHERTNRLKTAYINPRGKTAVTAYRVLETNDQATLIEARPVTGRLHQLRVHLDAIGCAIVGDPLYGSHISRLKAPRLMLHAHRLVLPHPAEPEREIDARADVPKDFGRTLRVHGLSRPTHQQDVSLPDADADETEMI